LPASEYPIILWLAAGNLNGLSIEKCLVLKGRDIMIFPDLGAFEKWSLKVSEIQKKHNYKVTISTLLEDEATNSDRAKGLDIADYIISELKFPLSSRRGVRGEVIPEMQSYFSPALQYMMERNKELLVLINRLDLEEV